MEKITIVPGFNVPGLRVSRRTLFQVSTASLATIAAAASGVGFLASTRRGRRILGIATADDALRECRDRFREAFHRLSPAEKELFRVAEMTPDTATYTCLDGLGGVAWSSRVIQLHETRGYQLKPHARALWYAGRIRLGTPVSLLFPDAPEVRAAASKAGWNPLRDAVEVYNSHGNRSPEYSSKADFTVLDLGDSFAQGMRLAQHETFSHLLQQRLARQFAPRKIQVVNTGVVGYGLEQEYETLRWCWEQLGYRPDIVVLHFYANDALARAHRVVEGAGDWDYVYAYLNRMRQYCQQRSVVFALSVVPHRQQMITLDDSIANYQAKVMSGANLVTHRVFNPLSRFANLNRMAASHVVPGEDAVNPFYIEGDVHFSPRGSQCYADLYAQFLTTLIRRHIA